MNRRNTLCQMCAVCDKTKVFCRNLCRTCYRYTRRIPNKRRLGTRERFIKKFRKMDNGCWEWQFGFDKDGYGQFGGKGFYDRAHRYAWKLFRGPIPDGQLVLHTCDNPPCCNPDHLFIGTTLDNVRDRVKKGRTSKGETCVLSKLTESQVYEIRKLQKEGLKIKDIAAQFSIHRSTVQRICLNKLWSHI